MQLKNQFGKISQPLMIGLLLLITFLIAVGIWFSSKDTTTDEHAHEESEHADEPEAEKGHAEEGEIQLTAQQLTEQGIQIASAQQGVDPLLNLQCGKTIGLGINLYLRIGNIRHCINRQFLIAINPDRNPCTDKEHDPNCILNRELNNSFKQTLRLG
jgi:hypothetical protein